MNARAKTALILALAASLVLSFFSERINPYFLRIAINVAINIVLAVSLNLVNGYTGQFSLGHAGFMAVGAYMSAWLTTVIGPHILTASAGAFSTALFFIVALLAGGIVSGVAGVLVGVPSLRLKGDYLAIVTLGFGEIIRVLLQNLDQVGGARGLPGIPPYTNAFWAYGAAIVTIYVVLALVHSTYGRGFQAVHDDEVAAEAMGINTTRYKVTAFVVGAFFAGIAGGLYAHFMQFINPEGFNFMKSVEIVVMVILGGMGNTIGVVIAAALLTILPEVLRAFSDYRMVIYSLLLVILMLTRPQGLFRWQKKSRPVLSA
jgi:branched-chain amino acid transport system permease protein